MKGMGKCKMAILLCLMAWTVQAQIRVSEWPEGKEGLKRNPDYEVYVKPLALEGSLSTITINVLNFKDFAKVIHLFISPL